MDIRPTRRHGDPTATMQTPEEMAARERILQTLSYVQEECRKYRDAEHGDGLQADLRLGVQEFCDAIVRQLLPKKQGKRTTTRQRHAGKGENAKHRIISK